MTDNLAPYNDGLAFVYIKPEKKDEGKEWLNQHGINIIFDCGKLLGVGGSPQYLKKLAAEKPEWLDRIMPNAYTARLIA